MSTTYKTSELALLNLIVANINGYTTDNTKAGKEDEAFSWAIQNSTNCCVLDYAGGDEDSQPSRIVNDQLWMWSCIVTFFIRYNRDSIETDIRDLSDNFMTMQRDNKRLSNNAYWRVQAARPFGILKRNDRSFLPMSFVIQIKTPI
jgi:hypothetical protein